MKTPVNAKSAKTAGKAGKSPKQTARKAAPAKGAKVAAPAKPPGGAPKPTKTDAAVKLLTSKSGATREELSKATGWPHVNVKQLAERRHMTMEQNGDRFRLV